jgi:O-antigen ligase
MTRPDPVSPLLLAALTLAPLLSWGEPPWAQGAFLLLLAGAAAFSSRRAAGGVRFGGGREPFLPLPMLAAFALAFLLGLVHLARLASPYHSASFLLLLFWALLFLRLIPRLRPPREWLLPLVLAWTGGEAALLLAHLLGGGAGQPQGTFTNPNHLATFFAVSLAFFLGSLMEGGRARGRSALLAGAALAATACLLAAGSRSGWLAALALWGFFALREKGARRWAAAGVVAAALLLPSPALHRVSVAGREDPYAFTRQEIWRMGARMGADHPLVGVGPGLFRFAADGYNFPVEGVAARFGRIANGPHNDYLRAWSEGGAPGAAAVLLFLFPLLASLPAAFRSGRAGPALAVPVFLFQMLFHDLTLSLAMVFLFLFWVALALPPSEGKGSRWWPGLPALLALSAFLAASASVADLAARGWWKRGRDSTGAPMSGRVELFIRGCSLSPFHPGITADLGAGLTAIYGSSHLPQVSAAAEEALTRACGLNRLDPVPLRRLAALYMARGAAARPESRDLDLARAGEALERALSLSPHDVFALRSLAAVREAQGRGEDALALLDRALADEPFFLGAHRDRARLLARMDPGRARGAERALAEAQAGALKRQRGEAGDAYEAELLKGD